MVESSDRMWSTGEGNGNPLQYSCLENTINRMKRQKDITLTESPQLEVVGHKVRTGCVHTSVSGSKWIVTAAHCLHEAPDSEGLSLHDLGLLSPSAFKIIMGECGPS